MTKALMPNFFARGDTVTPVKYSAVVFAVNLTFNLLLMQKFGHVGIATATTIAAFVSLGQYLHGLKKRGYWKFSTTLKWKFAKISFVSVMAGCLLVCMRLGLNTYMPQWETDSKLILLLLLGIMFVITLAFLLISARIFGIIDFAIIANLIRRKR